MRTPMLSKYFLSAGGQILPTRTLLLENAEGVGIDAVFYKLEMKMRSG